MAKFKVNPGDVFPIPTVKDGEYGFLLSRTIRTGTCETIEVFEKFHTDFLIRPDEALAQTQDLRARLFAPIYAVFLFDKMCGPTKWPVLARNPEYSESLSNVDEITFLLPDFEERGVYVKGEDFLKDATKTLVAERSTIWQQHQLVFRVGYYMNGLFNKGQVFNLGEVTGELFKEGLLTDATNDAIVISEAVAQKFKLASLQKVRGGL